MKAPKDKSSIENRRARFEYELGDEIIAGLSLTGPEVRAARDRHVQIRGAFIKPNNRGELFLTGATFTIKGDKNENVTDIADIKLLLKKSQARKLLEQRTQGNTIIPTKIFIKGRFIKLAIAVGRGKKLHDKRETIKLRDLERERRQKF